MTAKSRTFKILAITIMALVAVMVTSLVGARGADTAAPRAGEAEGSLVAASSTANVFGVSETGLYIVRFNEPALASYKGGIAGLEATSPEATGARKLDAQSPAALAYTDYLTQKHAQFAATMEQTLGRSVEVAFDYVAALNGMAVAVSHEEAAQLAALPGVAAVYGDTLRELATDVGPALIQAPAIWNGNTGSGTATRGEGVVIGVIDSGINSQHPAFAATDGDGYTHTNPYGAGTYLGWCAANPGFCNDKLIAAYGLNPVGASPEDTDGHGSHTASTAGGNRHDAIFNVGPTPYDISIQGVAPRANIVAYKVCNPSCPGTASVAAVNSAIATDQVDVLNYSISGSDSPWNDPVDIAFLDASNAGIFVSASAGNAGPGPSTVAKTGPWNAAVAASTHSRVIAHTLDVTGPGTPPDLQGLAAVPGEGTAIVADFSGELRYDATNNTGCTAFAPGTFTGAFALIQRGGCTFAVKVDNAVAAGATGVIMFNSVGGPPISMGGLTGTPPAFMLDLAGGSDLRDYVVANPGTTVRVNAATSYIIDTSWEDIVAGFSSRGPSQFEILKPDYIAPGVNILAAVATDGVDPVQYGFLQGTSMSSPHGAGAAALMVALHPTWSPAEVKSALATTAVGGLLKEDGATPADPFDVGSGRLDLSLASTMGLVFDETGANYAAANPALGGDPKTLNQPSVVNYNCSGTCTWTRTVKSVLDASATYTATTSGPAGLVITVTPSTFTIPAGGTQDIEITADVTALPLGNFAFGVATLETDATHPAPGSAPVADTNIPVVVIPTDTEPDISVSPTSMDASQPPDTTTTQALTIENVGTAPLTWSIVEAPLAMRLELTGDSVSAPEAPIALILDDGVGENAVGLTAGGQFLWLNRFTPTIGQFPVTLDQVDIMFGYPASTGGIIVGELVDIYLYEDADGNPANGAVHRASLTDQAVQAVDGVTWSTYSLTAPVTFNGPGDILIAVVNRTAGIAAGTFVAALDQTPPSQQRSWIGLGTGATTNPPTIPPATFGIVDSFGIAGNWMVRGFGEAFNACDNPADVGWLSVNPTGGTTAAGGSSNVTVTFDSTGLALGDYTALLCVNSNDPDMPLVEVPVSLTVGQAPNIDVDPLSLASTQAGNTTTQHPLDIGNTGASDLTWDIFEDGTEAALMMDWEDDFDSYATGSQLHGQGGWKGWFNDPAAGALTSDAQARSAPNSAAILGASDLVHEYSATDGQWVMTAWQYVPNDFTGQSYFIVLNTYNDAGTGLNWSTQVMFNGTTNQVLNDGGVSGGTLPLIRGQWVELRLEVDLDADTGAFYYNNQLLYSGTWSGQVSGSGATSIAAVDLFANGASVIYYDDMSLVDVTPAVVCDAPDDLLWLSVAPTSGTTAPAATTSVEVTLDSTGLADGVYNGNLCIASNDPDLGPGNGTDLVIVPVELTVAGAAPTIAIDPAALSSTQLADTQMTETLTISNTGDSDLMWDAYTWNPVVAGLDSFGPQLAPAVTGSDGQRGATAAIEAVPDAYVLDGDFTEGFDDITNLPGWFTQNNSSPVGTTGWFQGNDTVFSAHAGAPTAYIGANFNNTAGVGTISNWLLTPELTLYDGDTFSFWTRTTTGSSWPDRLELRLSTAGASTNVGTLATDVGDFTTLLVEVNPTLVVGGYPEVWTQFTATLSGIPNGTTGRFAFRYFVTSGGPSGSNSNYIGIDSVEYVSAAPTTCDAPVDVPWVMVTPISGTLPGGMAADLDVTFDSTGLTAGVYTTTLCINSNDPVTPLVEVPLTMTVAEATYLQVAHLAPFAEDASVTVALNGTPALTDFNYGDSTGYIELPAGMYDVEIFPTGSATPAITATVELMADTYYSAIATGDGVNQPLALVALVDDNSAPTAGTFKLRLGHLAPFAAGDALADIRLQDGTPVLTDVAYADITGYIELPAGTYDLKVTTPGGATTLIDPLPVTFADGDIITAFATGEGSNQALGVFAWPPDTMGFFLPLFEGYTLYLPLVLQP